VVRRALHQTAPLKIIDRIGDGGAAHVSAARQLALAQPVLLPQDAQELKNPHADPMLGDTRREGAGHGTRGVGEQETNGFLQPEIRECRLAIVWRLPPCLGRSLLHLTSLDKLPRARMTPRRRIDNLGK